MRLQVSNLTAQNRLLVSKKDAQLTELNVKIETLEQESSNLSHRYQKKPSQGRDWKDKFKICNQRCHNQGQVLAVVSPGGCMWVHMHPVHSPLLPLLMNCFVTVVV